MSGPRTTAWVLLAAVCCLPGLARATPPTAKELDRLEGKWSVDEKADPELFVFVSHKRQEGRVVSSVMRMKIGGPEGYVDYIGATDFEATTGKPRIVLHPVAAALVDLPEKLEYQIDGEWLLIWVSEGKHSGSYAYRRVPGR